MPKAKPVKSTKPEWTAERIRAIRERLGLTQTELGREIGVELRSVQYWEEGKQPSGPSAKLLEMLEARAGLAHRQS